MSESLYTLLQHAAGRHGQRPAIRFADRSLTYRELLDAADRAARALADRGAAPGVRVAFSFTKSIDAIVVLFGIIRTGATYVPIDPAWPAERAAMIVTDADIQIWTATRRPEHLDRTVPCYTSAPTDGANSIADMLTGPPAAGDPLAPHDGLANVLFTSGSTGRPKGVQITTGSLLHFSEWSVCQFALTADDVLSNHAPYNFDLSTFDIFAAVRAGAAMVPVPERLKMFPYQMAKFIADQRISVWYSVPSALVMMQLRGRLGAHDLSALRHVIFAGEVMPKPAFKAIAAELPKSIYTNLYGPTETNACTFYRVTSDDLAHDSSLPIGRPIDDTHVWIVDEDLRPVPPGESGELLVAGPTVTTGYLGDAELTAARLVPAPRCEELAYRTGDRVRARSDGALLFEGRIDRMIKCRGHRIEPGEVEAALTKHPDVKEAAVVPCADPIFGHRLRACLAARDGASLNEANLLAFCREHLPPYMVPDEWKFFDALPRTDREKIDLRALME